MKKHTQAANILLFILITSWMPGIMTGQEEQLTMIHGATPGIYMKGFVILLNRDTVYGKLKWSQKYVENNPVEIKFTPEGGEPWVYNAIDIRGLGMYWPSPDEPDGTVTAPRLEIYETLASFKKGVPVFMNRLLDGRIRIYNNRSAPAMTGQTVEVQREMEGIAFSFTITDGLSIGPYYRISYKIIEEHTRFRNCFVIKDFGSMVKVDKGNYEQVFPTLFGDCPALSKELEKNPDLKEYKNFMLLAEIYNQICGR
jgi:hypothetical protein